MKIEVLDHGYVEFVEAWGHGKDGCDNRVEREQGEPYVLMDEDNECGIVEAARQSTQGSFRGWDQDAKLLKYLYEHDHQTPFEFAGMVIEVQAPIFVFREWQRHRTQSYNEMSARYAPLPDLYYVPTAVNVFSRMKESGNKQESGARGTSKAAQDFAAAVQDWYQHAEDLYKNSIQLGIPKELARLGMPVGHYSRMRASANLRNWLGFLTLRMDPASQWEIRQFANAVGQIVEAKFPRTWELFNGK